jgi:threonine aldolase
MFGGGMRQAGIIAAGALYALDHHVERLEVDHANAKRLAEGVAEIPGYSVDLAAVETNIVNIQVDPRLGLAAKVCEKLEAAGVWMLPIWPQTIRAVTHLDVSAEGIERALEVFRGMRL